MGNFWGITVATMAELLADMDFCLNLLVGIPIPVSGFSTFKPENGSKIKLL